MKFFTNLYWPLIVILALFGTGIGADCANAEKLYVTNGRRGSVTFSSRPPTKKYDYRFVQEKGPRYSKLIRVRGEPESRRLTLSGRKSRYDDLIRQFSKVYDLEAALVKAVVHAESAFDPQARSHKGAMGLMQLMPGTAKRFGVRNAYQPFENVKAGTRYLSWLMDRYKGDERLAIAAYNAGEGAVDKYKRVPPYQETQQYVKKVLALRGIYRCAIEGNTNC